MPDDCRRPRRVRPPRRPALMTGRGRLLRGLMLALCLTGCAGPQSALVPGGEDAETIAQIFKVMLAGAVVLWFVINGLFYLSRLIHPRTLDTATVNRIVIAGGIVMPVVLLGALLAWGLSILPDHRRSGDGLTIRVTGEQWWWRVEYWPEGAGAPVVSANEIRLPVGETVEFELEAKRVIHSFWIPALGGKMDMFPGRVTRLSLHAIRPGTWRGQCTEFCGESHAWMAFQAVAMPAEEFETWLSAEAGGATAPEGDEAARGAEIFAREGCGACHAIRGTDHAGRVGPDLTHVGSRLSLAAGRLGTAPEDFAAWIARPGSFKPGVAMPGFAHLPPRELADLAAYLGGLE